MIIMNWIPIGLNWTILFKCLEMTIVVIWRYINKTELNWIECPRSEETNSRAAKSTGSAQSPDSPFPFPLLLLKQMNVVRQVVQQSVCRMEGQDPGTASGVVKMDILHQIAMKRPIQPWLKGKGDSYKKDSFCGKPRAALPERSL